MFFRQKFCKSKSNENYAVYKQQRNKVNNLIKKAKQTFYKNLLRENSTNPTSFWKSLKKLFPTKPKASNSCSTFKVKNEETSDKEKIANRFINFFLTLQQNCYVDFTQ